MRVVIEYTNGDKKELDTTNALFIEYQWSDMTIWGGDKQDPVELYSIDCGRPFSMSMIRVWNHINGQCTKDDEVTDENADIIALDAVVKVTD